MTEENKREENRAEDREEGRKERADPSNRVRQGVTGHNVRYVLVISLLALLACYAVIVTYFTGN